jgi:hypothetical protein
MIGESESGVCIRTEKTHAIRLESESGTARAVRLQVNINAAKTSLTQRSRHNTQNLELTGRIQLFLTVRALCMFWINSSEC